MRILFCNFEYPPLGGGGGVINALLARELGRRHDVTVLTSRGPGLPPREVSDGVAIVRVPVLTRGSAAAASMVSMACYVPMGIAAGSRLLGGRGFDVINTHFVVPTGPVGHVLSSRWRIPNVLTVHGGDLYDPTKASSPHRHASLRLVIRYLLKRADLVIGQSANTLQNIATYYRADVQARLIPLGIERSAPVAATRQSLGLPRDAVVLVTVGRLVPRKAVDQLLRMLPALDARVFLVVIGDGPLRASLEARAAELGVADRTMFAGFVDESQKRALLGASDLYVSTSQHEGFGLVYLEAMAAGLPVVCYDFGGQTDFLEDGRTGAVVALNDTAGFVERCRFLIGAPAARQAAAAENLVRVQRYFIDHCAVLYEQAFAEVIAARQSHATAQARASEDHAG